MVNIAELGLDEILSKEWLKKWEQVDKSKLSDEFIDEFVTNIELARTGDYYLDKITRATIQQEAIRVVKEMIEEALEWN